MVRWLPAIIAIALFVYCLIDCAQAEDSRVRNLPRWAWIVLIVVFPIVGALAWLVAGRPDGFGAGRGSAPKGPDDDPEFLMNLEAESQHRRRLQSWEQDLRRRESEQNRTEHLPEDDAEPGSPNVPG